MFDPREADASYRSFPSFVDWARCRVDDVRWKRYTAILEERGSTSPEQLAEAREVLKRAAAVDTGALEGLYEVDRGFTFAVATQAAIWEAKLDSKGQQVRALIESQLRAYDYVLDVATQHTPLSESWIRTLHRELCASQATYSVVTEVGPQTHRLPLGEYKHLSNHVRTREGGIHSYAPVDLVPAEMHRLVETLRSDEFLAAHPVLQASYAHYAFVMIHPFADGNGRVAQALGSIFTYRSHSVPLLILVENRKEYLDSLVAADRNHHQAFVDFVMERALDAILLVNESLGAAVSPQPADALGALDALFTTQGGYPQDQVDHAGIDLLEFVKLEIEEQAEKLNDNGRLRISTVDARSADRLSGVPPHHRAPRTDEGYPYLSLSLKASEPLAVGSHRHLVVAVPNDAGRDDDVSVVETSTLRRVFTARVSELIPAPAGGMRMRLSIAVQRLLGEGIQELVEKAKAQR